MTTREGSLEAPTRHPLGWQEPAFYDEQKVVAELERVFDICHGCRRCVNLCTAFPRLFDLIDEGKTGELDGVDKSRFGEVVDRCYLCDTCYMTKCPYVPPHSWNVDFPHLVLRAKALKYKQGGTSLRDKLLTSTEAVGKLATIPVVVRFVNAANKSPLARGAMDKVLGVHKDRVLPEYAGRTFRAHAHPDASFAVRAGKTTPGKVAVFATCYVNYNEPGLGHDLLKILAHNVPAIVVEKEACCGMPKLELGDLDAVAKLKEINIPHLAKLAREGYAILTAIPSCTLMFKQELPLMFPHDADVKAVKAAMFDPFEYLVMRNKDGLLKTDFKHGLGKVSYHIPCHSRVQNVGQKTREMLALVPATEVSTIERCSGHDGTWGVKTEFFEQSMKIGRPVFRQMAASDPDFISSDCPIAARSYRAGHRRIERAQRASARIAAYRIRRLNFPHGSTMTHITADSLLTLEAYAKQRKDFRARVLAHKKQRTVALGEHVTLILEDELTVRYQIQEMLRVERIFEEAGIHDELDAYNPLIPDGSNWKATMLIEYPDVAERQVKLALLRGIEDKVWVRVTGYERVYAVADEDMERTNDEKTSAVHFLRFELTPPMTAALGAGGDLAIGVDHPAYGEAVDRVPAAVKSSLIADLRG